MSAGRRRSPSLNRAARRQATGTCLLSRQLIRAGGTSPVRQSLLQSANVADRVKWRKYCPFKDVCNRQSPVRHLANKDGKTPPVRLNHATSASRRPTTNSRCRSDGGERRKPTRLGYGVD